MANTYADAFDDRLAFNDMLETIGLSAVQRARIVTDGCATMKELVDQYKISGPNELEKHIKDLNKTFATAATNTGLRVYFSPKLIKRLCGVLFYFRIVVLYFHSVSDIEDISEELADHYGDIWMNHESSLKQDDLDDDFTVPKLKGQSNWIEFRDSIIHKLKNVQSGTEFSLHYLISDTPRRVLKSNANLIELDGFLDLDLEQVFYDRTVHFGSHFKSDNSKFWTLLEGLLINTDPYNYIAEFSKTKNGRKAWKELCKRFEGEDSFQRIRNSAMNRLKTVSYRGDTRYFKWEHYHNAHVKAHKDLYDIGYNDGKGMDDETKIFHFKSGITPQADLETALTLARPKEKGTFSDYVTYLSTEVDSKNERKKQFSVPHKNVSASKRENKTNKRKKPDLGPVLFEIVDGKRVESKFYDRGEYNSLNYKQKQAVRRLNSERKAKVYQNKRGVSAVSMTEHDLSTLEGKIISALNHGAAEKGDTVVTDKSDTESKSKTTQVALAGEVGNLFAAARRKASR